ncbi:MAG: hypothetical protein R3348_06585 [Xanthomonadales bacterium]|nr:hypothetical protein [Xanthomonadales bacterium]
MNRSILPALLAFITLPVLADWDDCKHEREIESALDVAGSSQLLVEARAGTLVITGREGASQVRIAARVCASKAEWADEAELEVSEGRTARVAAGLPDIDGGWSFFGGNRYARMDLEIEVPADLALDIRDSSGSIRLRSAGPARIEDSSGSITVEDGRGDVEIEDSSGSIKLNQVEGNVLVRRDSSGSISGEGITGSVRIVRDGSGSIRFDDVGGDFTVERDGSGSISAYGVGGDFRVVRDGSGSITARNVKGSVSTPGD